MTSAESSTGVIILHIPAGSVEWAGILAQFTLSLSQREGRAFAAWAAERVSRLTQTNEGVVALADGTLRGMLLIELVGNTAELTLPWTPEVDPVVARMLAEAAVQVAREHTDLDYIRAERQLLPGEADTAGMEAAGFHCYWRWRMRLELEYLRGEAAAPAGYRLTDWQVDYIDTAAQVIYQSNIGTLDALLYAPFFGTSTVQCRKGLLAILAGRYGPIHPRATICVFQEEHLVGVNLVINENDRLASVVEISVLPTHQRQGVGRALLAQSLRRLKNEHYEQVELAVTKDNHGALRLYKSLGFTTFGDFPVCII